MDQCQNMRSEVRGLRPVTFAGAIVIRALVLFSPHYYEDAFCTSGRRVAAALTVRRIVSLQLLWKTRRRAGNEFRTAMP